MTRQVRFRLRYGAVILAACTLLAAGCLEIQTRPRIVITPEAVPEEIEGATWERLPVTYCVVRSEEGFEPHEVFANLTEEAFASWGLPAESDGECEGPAGQGNGVNEVSWGEPRRELEGAHPAGYTSLLYERCVSNCPSGSLARIVEADISITAEVPSRLERRECLFASLLHETGHFLGVHHLEAPAVMAPISFSCPQELTGADRRALEQLYSD